MNKVYFLPNALTVLRIMITPFCIYYIFIESMFLAFLLFVMASVTDALDGYFARKFNSISKLGSFLDPLADKFLVVSVFTTFYYLYPQIIDEYILIMILFRDVFVTILRIIMENMIGSTMETSRLSKIKTIIQFSMITVIFINSMQIYFNINNEVLYYLMLITAILTFYTGIHYVLSNYKQLKTLIAK